ncbi:MAG TPA: carboxypeptidase regulatory-like domain-containing protein [Thermoanaerobaculia bacterium]|nr:carboxypeptidase regulatory-like domain-containing protein [Thermoanaerobaculia bacterium]
MNRWKLSLVLALGALQVGLAHGAEVTGKVLWKGPAPAVKALPSDKDASVCGKSHAEFPRVEVGTGGGLKDTVIQIVGAKDTRPPGQVTLDQQKCMFVPSVSIVPVGWTLGITSSDPILHNTHAFWQDGASAFNLAVPIQGMVMKWKADRPGELKLRCDAGHTWMGAAIVVTSSPFAMVTKDDGTFSFKDVPPGTYTIEAWHPLLGKKTQTVTVASASSAVAFEFAPK